MSDGHSVFSDMSFQIWAYGAAITDAGDGSYSPYSHCSWAHYSLAVNGIGQYQNPDEPTHPYYAKILAYTNAPDYVYCAADGTECYPIDQRNNGSGISGAGDTSGPATYATLACASPAPLSFLTGVQRQILFQHHRYFVVYDTLSGTSNATYSMIYHVLEPTLTNLSGGSFVYTCTNQRTGGNPVTVYVQSMIDPSLLSVIDMTNTPINPAYPFSGTNISANYPNFECNPFTQENYLGLDTGGTGSGSGFPYFPRHDVLWISNKKPTNNWHFMTVIYPVQPGGVAPTITTLGDSTVSVSAGGTNDVISFNPQSPNISQVNFLVNSPAIVATGGPDTTVIGVTPTPYKSVLLANNILDSGTSTAGGSAGSSGGGSSGGSTTTYSASTGLPTPHAWVLSQMTSNQMNSFSPVPGYFAWWNPDSLGTWNGSPSNVQDAPISAWVDNSSARMTAIQTSSAAQPTLLLQGQNGHNALYFNGTNFLRWTSSAALTGPIEIFMVEQEYNPAGHAAEIFLTSDNSPNNRPCQLLDGHQTYYGTFIARVIGGQLISSDLSDGQLASTNWYVVTALFDGANSQVWTNGVSAIYGTLDTTAVLEGVDIGANSSGGQNFYGCVGDIIVYTNVLSGAQQQTIVSGLRAKYGF